MTAWMMCVRVNIICKILHNRWIPIWQLEWCALKWTLSVRYFTAGGYWYDSSNDVRYSEHYLEDTLQQEDRGMTDGMMCVTVNIICNLLYSMWILVWQLEEFALQWTLPVRYFTACGYWYDRLNDVRYIELYL